MQERWQKLFVPLARELAGTMLPWASLDLDQVRALFKRTWPSSEYIVQKGDVYWNLVMFATSYVIYISVDTSFFRLPTV